MSTQRVALVTGGARGIGAAVCRALCDQKVAVAVADLRDELAMQTAAQLTAAGHRAVGVALDVTDTESVAAAVGVVRSQLGEVDVLVNNAGWDELRPFVETDEAFWERIVDINYMGALRVTREVLPGMIDRGWGRLVFTASDAGRVGSSLESVYAGAKGGTIAFAKSVARSGRGDRERRLPGADPDRAARGAHRRSGGRGEGDRGDDTGGADEASGTTRGRRSGRRVLLLRAGRLHHRPTLSVSGGLTMA